MTGRQDPVAAGGDRLRAGHFDRERVIEALKQAVVHGRLSRDELDVRVGRALAARTRAELAALTADIPAEPVAAKPAAVVPALAVPPPTEPVAAPPGPARPSVPAIRRPLAKAAAGSGVCLIIAAAAILIGGHIAEAGSGPSPYHSLVGALFLLALFAVMTALLTVALGVATAIEQRRSRRQLPPRSGPGGRTLDGKRHDDGTSHDPVPPRPRTNQTRTDLRARKSWPPAAAAC
jgi:hypothetical protein